MRHYPHLVGASTIALSMSLAGLPAVSFAGNNNDLVEASTAVEGPEPAPAGAAAAPVTEPPGKGIGLIVGGSVITALIGLPFSAWGISVLGVALPACRTANNITMDSTGVVNAACDITRNLGIGVLVTGLIGLGGGGTMIGFGARNNIRYKEWKRANGLAFTPSFGTTAHRTPTYGFSVRF